MPLASGELLLGDSESRYVHKVHRLGRGARFQAFDPVQRVWAEACIVEVSPRVRCRIGELVAVPPSPHDVTLLYGLAKGDKLDLVVRDATALGAGRIVLVETERSVVRLDALRGAERAQRLRTVAIESARQCGRGDLPVLQGPLGLAQGFELADDSRGARMILDAAAAEPLAALLAGWDAESPLALAVGPEGGFSEAELGLAQRHGFTPASLGPLTLRTETAVVAALGAVLGRLHGGA